MTSQQKTKPMESHTVAGKIDAVKHLFEQSITKAETLHSNYDKLKIISEEAMNKGERVRSKIQPAFGHLQLFFALIRAYTQGAYTSIDKKHIIQIIAGLIYFVSPVDAFPDFVPAFGFLDDAFILGLVASCTFDAVSAFKAQQSRASVQN